MNFEGRIGHLENVSSPWGNAGGVAKTLADVQALARTGVGWIEGGSFTLEPRLGNAVDPNAPEEGPVRKVLDYDEALGVMINSLGMPNHGLAAEEAILPEKNDWAEASGKTYVVNVAPVSDDPIAESHELVERAYAAGARAVLLNAGCPNVVTADGGRHEILSNQPRVLAKGLKGLKPLTEQFAPIFIRISPTANYWSMKTVCAAIERSEVVSAVFTPNTWPGHTPRSGPLDVPDGTGGRSGPAMARPAAEQTTWALWALHGSSIDVVSSSGIMTSEHLAYRLRLGAVAAAGTTFYYQSSNWQRDTDKLLSGLSEN